MVGYRRYIVGARAAIVESTPVAKRNSKDLNTRPDMVALDSRIVCFGSKKPSF